MPVLARWFQYDRSSVTFCIIYKSSCPCDVISEVCSLLGSALVMSRRSVDHVETTTCSCSFAFAQAVWWDAEDGARCQFQRDGSRWFEVPVPSRKCGPFRQHCVGPRRWRRNRCNVLPRHQTWAAETRVKVAKLEKALEALEGTNGVGSFSCCFPACHFSVRQGVARSQNAILAEEAHLACCRKRWRQKADIPRRAHRALRCVLDGELSAAWQALEGAEMALVTEKTHKVLTNPLKRPSEPRSRMPDWVRTHEPEEPVVLDGEEFVKCLRNSRRGAAPGPSGMCPEHLRLLFDHESDVMAITMFANSFARGQIPSDVVAKARRRGAGHRGGWLLQEIGVTNIGEAICAEGRGRQPHRFSSTHSKPEQGASVSPTWCRHLQSSVTASRSFQWMEWGFTTSCPVQQCSGDSWTWRKVTDCCHLSICSVLIHPLSCGMTKLETPTRSGKEREENKEMCWCLSYLASDSMVFKSSGKKFGGRRASVYISGRSSRALPIDRVQAVHQTMVQELWDHARISLHNGKTKVWNRGGIAPSGWSNLQQMASKEDPGAVVWRGDTFLPTSRQGLLILGTTHGSRWFCQRAAPQPPGKTRRSAAAHSCSPSPSSSSAPPDFLRCRSSELHIEDSPPCIGGRVCSLAQSRHLDMSGEDSWHWRASDARNSVASMASVRSGRERHQEGVGFQRAGWSGPQRKPPASIVPLVGNEGAFMDVLGGGAKRGAGRRRWGGLAKNGGVWVEGSTRRQRWRGRRRTEEKEGMWKKVEPRWPPISQWAGGWGKTTWTTGMPWRRMVGSGSSDLTVASQEMRRAPGSWCSRGEIESLVWLCAASCWWGWHQGGSLRWKCWISLWNVATQKLSWSWRQTRSRWLRHSRRTRWTRGEEPSPCWRRVRLVAVAAMECLKGVIVEVNATSWRDLDGQPYGTSGRAADRGHPGFLPTCAAEQKRWRPWCRRRSSGSTGRDGSRAFVVSTKEALPRGFCTVSRRWRSVELQPRCRSWHDRFSHRGVLRVPGS